MLSGRAIEHRAKAVKIKVLAACAGDGASDLRDVTVFFPASQVKVHKTKGTITIPAWLERRKAEEMNRNCRERYGHGLAFYNFEDHSPSSAVKRLVVKMARNDRSRREALKKLGGKWNSLETAWIPPLEGRAAVRSLEKAGR